MKMRSIIVNELTVTDPVRYKVYQDQVPALCSAVNMCRAARRSR